MQYLGKQVLLTYELPLNDAVWFFDRLKSVSKGTSLDYELSEFQTSDLVKLDV